MSTIGKESFLSAVGCCSVPSKRNGLLVTGLPDRVSYSELGMVTWGIIVIPLHRYDT